jgi:hypothetical protein
MGNPTTAQNPQQQMEITRCAASQLNMRMSAFGTKQTSSYRPAMSAFGGKADMAQAAQNVRF